ncbi:hypothetical protein QOU59_28820, partial [Pseudomonas aeruginosa]
STTGYHLRWPKKNSTHCPGWVDHYTTATGSPAPLAEKPSEINKNPAPGFTCRRASGKKAPWPQKPSERASYNGIT